MIKRMGRPRNEVVKKIIPRILKKYRLANPQMIKREYQSLTGKGVGYDTVINALSDLVKERILIEDVISKTKNRTIRLYSLR
ncbi:MAG: hypothetical protein HWN67_12305 [Candidatus Helarchaeota archaeon]|nr:hypothetical protein [Candidatus Helarchaeota archaeon]